MTTIPAGTVVQSIVKPKTKALTKFQSKKQNGIIKTETQKKFIQILKDDHNFDVVLEIVKEIAMIKRAKKLKPLDKRRLIKDYLTTMLSYCMPKQKIVEDNRDDGGKGVTFNITVGGSSDEKPKLKKAGKGSTTKSGGVNISIPTVKNSDGSYSVSAEKN